MAKHGMALMLAIALMAWGHHGKRQATLSAELDELLLVSAQVQQVLNQFTRLPEPHEQPAQSATAIAAGSPLLVENLRTAASALDTELERFTTQFGSRITTRADTRNLKRCQAILANAERRYQDALGGLPPANDDPFGTATTPGAMHLTPFPRIRADAFYGLRQWSAALERYREFAEHRPLEIVAMARATECLYAMGQLAEAFTNVSELAARHDARGRKRLSRRRFDDALQEFNKSISIYSQLVEKGGRNEFQNDLAAAYNHRGNAHLFKQQWDAAIHDLTQAIEIRTRLAAAEDRLEFQHNLAICHTNRGIAHRRRGAAASALEDYRRAIQIRTSLVEKEGRQDFVDALASNLDVAAWLMATSTQTALRDGESAKQFALKACELANWENSKFVETLAAACAESGEFADAARWQQKAIDMAADTASESSRARLDAYRSSKPVRDSRP